MNDLIKRGKKVFTVSVVVTTIFWSMGLAALLVPLTAQAVALSAGDLIKGESLTAVYYYHSDGNRYVFPNDKAYFTWYEDFSGVQTITDDELAAVPMGDSNVTYRAGARLIKVQSATAVYAVEPNGVRRHITSEEVAQSLYGDDWATLVDDVSDAFWENYTTGDELSEATYPTGTLVKTADSADVYYVDGATKRKVADSAAMSANLLQDKYVVTASDLSAYTDGTEISAAETDLSNVSQVKVEEEVVAGLTMALSSATPAASTAPFSAADVVFTKLDLTAGSDAAVSLTSLKVTRSGLSANSDFAALKVYDGNIQQGTNQTLDSNNQATFNFTTAISVAAGTTKTLTLAGNIAASGTATAGNAIVLGINAASDVGTTATLSGTFPMKGNSVTVASTTIGTLEIVAGGSNPSADLTANVGDVDVLLLQARLTAGSTEDVEVTQFTAVKGGTHTTNDVTNIELYNETDTASVATLSTWDSNSRAVFDLSADPLTIVKGASKLLSVRVDIAAGSGRTVSAAVRDAGQYTLMVKGKTYGFGITPTSATGWLGTATAQTINAGSLSIAKSASSPATGYVSPGATDEPLAAFDFTVRGESVRITQLLLTLTPLNGSSAADLTGVKLVDPDGKVVAGPKNGTTSTINTAQNLTYTDTVTAPVGTTTYTVQATIATGALADETYAVSLTDPSANMTVTGLTSGNSITPTPSADVAGNTMTVRAGALSVVTMTTPPAASIVPGQQGITFANYLFDASSSGEDLRVTAVGVYNTVSGAGAAVTDLASLKLYYEDERLQTTNDTGSPSAAKTTFNLSTPLTITKGESKVIVLKGDYKSGVGAASESHTFDVNAAGDMTVTGVSTGNSVTPSISGSGQAMTYASTGTLTSVIDPSTPTSDIVVAGSTGVTMTVVKLTAANEDIKVNTMALTRTSVGTGADADLSKVYLYDASTLLAQGYLGASSKVTFDITGLTDPLIIKRSDSKKLTVKADFNTVIGGATPGYADALDLAATTDVTATGQASGSTVNASAAVTGNDMYVYKTKVTVDRTTNSISTLVNGTISLLRFTIKADAGADAYVYKITPAVTATTASVTAASVQVIDVTDATEQTLNATGVNASTTGVDLVFDAQEVIPAGTTRTYELRGTVTGSATGASVVSRLLGDSAAATVGTGASANIGTAAEIDSDSNDNFIWSDSSNASHATTTKDWTNGYLIKTLPTSFEALSYGA